MSTDVLTTEDARRELAEILAGHRDPETVRRACERMDRMREEIRRRVGTVDVAVPFIRELRDR